MHAQSTTSRPKMTASEATTFHRHSVGNAVQAIHALRESGACSGTCEPYRDMYTYQRWQAQGYQVRKGAHGARLSIMIERTGEDEDGENRTIRRPWHTTVFCRCQVDAKGGR